MAYLELLCASRLNNRGASYIQNGEFDKSKVRLTTALEAISKCRSRKVLQDDGSSATQLGNLDYFMTPIPMTEDDKTCPIDDRGFLYQSPIVIPTAILEGNTEKLLEIISVAILFNLALAHQFAAMEFNVPCPHQLRKAVRFYEFGFEVHDDANLSSLQFHLASINNLGHALQALGETEKSELCFRNLLASLMYLVDGGNVDGRYCEGFFQNVSHLIFPNESVAARAA
jgi:tetratricopeptide (TPR) repeat protein